MMTAKICPEATVCFVCMCLGVWSCLSPSSSVQMWSWSLQVLMQWRVTSLLSGATMSLPSVSEKFLLLRERLIPLNGS